MDPLSVFFLCLFLISTAVHLYGSWKNDRKIRGISKPLLLPALLGLYLSLCAAPLPSLIIALLLSWIGDVFLIPKGTKWFVIGGISFLIGHIFFVLAYATEVNFSRISLAWKLLLPLLFATAVCIIFRRLKQHLSRALFWPMFLYLLTNGAMNCFALFRLLSCPSPETLLTAVGAFLFFVSDTALFFVRFNKNSRMKSHFLVMLTYTIGELLIVLGMI